MNKTASSVATIGLSAFALPAYAQDFYAGGALSFGEIELSNFNESNEIRSFDAFGGARFDIGSSLYAGIEVQATFSDGYIAGDSSAPGQNSTFQGEAHLGFSTDWGRVFGFVGFGKTDLSVLNNPAVTTGSNVRLHGVGMDVFLAENLALRVEVEVGNMSVTDNCCGAFNVSTREASLGVVYDF